MKKLLSIFVTLLFANLAFAQTATNFNVNDCAGLPHNLFNELDGGKVVVLVWVMPCSNCVGPAVTSHNVVQSFQSSNPNKVVMYLVDDYANTTCTSLDAWAVSNGLTNTTKFSNTAISMSHYGSAGMPKVVVLGGTNHAVYYNANNSVNQTSLQNAINSALAAAPTGIAENAGKLALASVFPNPAADNSSIKFEVEKQAEVAVKVYNHLGQKITDIFEGEVASGEKQIAISTANWANGIYFVDLKIAGKTRMVKLLVNH